MERDWQDFKSLHSNFEGAREAFEKACCDLVRKIYPDEAVSRMRVSQGDGGIDIFIGEFGVEPITVIQCKFFLLEFGDSQKQQVTKSFEKAMNASDYSVKEWILYLPYVFDRKQNTWWSGWKSRMIKRYSKNKNFISRKNGDELIALMKESKVYNEIFKIEDSLKLDRILNILEPNNNLVGKIISNPKVDTNVVLFNNFTEASAKYYQDRSIDSEFFQKLSINNLWVFGTSGSGKTAFVNRNLIINNIAFCYCDLSPITIDSSDDVLEDILSTIEIKFSTERSNNLTNKVKQIAHIVATLCKKNMVIVVDELSVREPLLSEIFDKLFKIVLFYNNSNPGTSLKFIISTIKNPSLIIDEYSKATEYFHFVDCSDWNESISNLFDILNQALQLNLDKHKQTMLDYCNGSPRTLKLIFRKILSCSNLNESEILYILETVKEEII